MKFRGLIFANLFRKKLRLILTVGSFAVALFLFAFLAVVRGAFSRGADIAGADRLVTINRVSIIQPLPLVVSRQNPAHSGGQGASPTTIGSAASIRTKRTSSRSS